MVVNLAERDPSGSNELRILPTPSALVFWSPSASGSFATASLLGTSILKVEMIWSAILLLSEDRRGESGLIYTLLVFQLQRTDRRTLGLFLNIVTFQLSVLLTKSSTSPVIDDKYEGPAPCKNRCKRKLLN